MILDDVSGFRRCIVTGIWYSFEFQGECRAGHDRWRYRMSSISIYRLIMPQRVIIRHHLRHCPWHLTLSYSCHHFNMARQQQSPRKTFSVAQITGCQLPDTISKGESEDPVGWYNTKHRYHLCGRYFDRAALVYRCSLDERICSSWATSQGIGTGPSSSASHHEGV
jgi:hypothetical protein